MGVSANGGRDNARTASHVAGGAALMLGACVILGWHFHVRALVQVSRTFVPMQYNTALGFLAVGAGLLLAARGKLRAGAAALAAMTVTVGAWQALLAAEDASTRREASSSRKPPPSPRRLPSKHRRIVGDLGGGPRDLIDLHVAATAAAVEGAPPQRASAYSVEGRLFALEMMGFLVDYYRVGVRRRAERENGDEVQT